MPGADISDVANGSATSSPRRCASALALALAIIAAGGFVIFEAVTGPGNPGYAEVGPGVIPGIVGGTLSFVGLALLVQAVRGQWQVVWFDRESTTGPLPAPLRNVLLVAAALILDVALIAPFGFIVASAVLFTLVAAAFGSRRFVLDAALGLAFGGAIYLVFVHGLGLSLPVGSVWGSLPWIS